MNHIVIAGLIVSCVLGFAGCASTAKEHDGRSLDGTAWVLSSLAGIDPVPDVTPTAKFDAGRLSGSDGCNRFSMPYTTSGSAIEIGQSGISTQMACPEDTMAYAAAFTAALRKARSFRMSDETLVLRDASGSTVMTLVAQARLLAGTSWNVTMINNGKEAVVGVVDGSAVTMSFDAAGRVSGSAGCNRYTAAYTVDGDMLRFTKAAATRMACADPAVSRQEQQFLRALESVTTMQFEGDRLDLRGADGALAMMLTRTR